MYKHLPLLHFLLLFKVFSQAKTQKGGARFACAALLLLFWSRKLQKPSTTNDSQRQNQETHQNPYGEILKQPMATFCLKGAENLDFSTAAPLEPRLLMRNAAPRRFGA